MSMPTVSVLTTSYNREKLLGFAIESVLASSFSDFEYIIVDDCSTDGTAEVAKAFEEKDRRIKVHVNEVNLGDYGNRKKAASLASGKYLKYVDSDDLIYAHCLEVMVKYMETYPDAALGLCRPHNPEGPYPHYLRPEESYRQHFLENGLFHNGPISTIIRRDSYEAVGGFSGRRYLGDTELWLKLARTNPVVVMPRGLTWWRDHDEQEIAIEHATLEAVVPRYKMQLEQVSDPNCPLSREDRQLAIARIRKRHIRFLLSTGRRRSLSSAFKLMRESEIEFGDVFGELVRGQ